MTFLQNWPIESPSYRVSPRRKCFLPPETLFQLNILAGGRGYFSPPRRESRPPHKNVLNWKKLCVMIFWIFNVRFILNWFKTFYFLTQSMNICEWIVLYNLYTNTCWVCTQHVFVFCTNTTQTDRLQLSLFE